MIGRCHGWKLEKSVIFLQKQARPTSTARARFEPCTTFLLCHAATTIADGWFVCLQLAVYNFASRGEWFATQNMCPHKRTIALSRGLIGDKSGTPSVACESCPSLL